MPRASYVISASPRCGSYLLCDLLTQTGVAGKPTEYVSQNYERHWSARWRTSSYREFLDRVLETGTTPNGFFGLKVHYYQWRYFLWRLAILAGESLRTERELLDGVVSNPKYIWLTRRDRLGQAVSYLRATQSNVWWLAEHVPAPCGAPTRREPRFTFRELDRVLHRMAREDAGWRMFFEAQGITPLHVEYEDLAAGGAAIAARVLDFLELPSCTAGLIRPRMERQADALSTAWTDRFRRLKSAQRQKTVSAFKDIHRGEDIVVCGCGGSLNDLARPERFVTIGVNDVGRRFHPNYLVVLDGRRKFSEERFKAIETSESDFLFTDQQLGIPHPDVVKVVLTRQNDPDWAGPHPLHYLARPWYTPYVAMTLAAYMGARRVGLIGVDFTDDHFFAATGPYSGARHLPLVEDHFRRLNAALLAQGTKVLNLSAISRITAFPRISLEEFAVQRRLPQSHRKDRPPLRILVYSGVSGDPFPHTLSKYINCATPHYSRAVRAGEQVRNGRAVDLDQLECPEVVDAELAAADLVIVHNGIVDRAHRYILERKPVVTIVDGAAGEMNWSYVRAGFPVAVLSQHCHRSEWSGRPLVATPAGWLAEGRSARQGALVVGYIVDERLPSRDDERLRAIRAAAEKAGATVLSIDADAGADRVGAADLVVDGTANGYSPVSLAALARGIAVVSSMAANADVRDGFRRAAGGERSSPFVFASADSLDRAMTDLLGRGRAALEAEGAAARDWMTHHWRFDWQWDELWLPLVEEALRQREALPAAAAWSNGAAV